VTISARFLRRRVSAAPEGVSRDPHAHTHLGWPVANVAYDLGPGAEPSRGRLLRFDTRAYTPLNGVRTHVRLRVSRLPANRPGPNGFTQPLHQTTGPASLWDNPWVRLVWQAESVCFRGLYAFGAFERPCVRTPLQFFSGGVEVEESRQHSVKALAAARLIADSGLPDAFLTDLHVKEFTIWRDAAEQTVLPENPHVHPGGLNPDAVVDTAYRSEKLVIQIPQGRVGYHHPRIGLRRSFQLQAVQRISS